MEPLNDAIYVYLLLINLYLFCLMYFDKQQAKKKKWRIPEANLLFLGIIGGGLGGLIGQRMFHHKGQKKKFTICFITGIVIGSLLLAFTA